MRTYLSLHPQSQLSKKKPAVVNVVEFILHYTMVITFIQRSLFYFTICSQIKRSTLQRRRCVTYSVNTTRATLWQIIRLYALL